jgi:hypothetical protein
MNGSTDRSLSSQTAVLQVAEDPQAKAIVRKRKERVVSFEE